MECGEQRNNLCSRNWEPVDVDGDLLCRLTQRKRIAIRVRELLTTLNHVYQVWCRVVSWTLAVAVLVTWREDPTAVDWELRTTTS